MPRLDEIFIHAPGDRSARIFDLDFSINRLACDTEDFEEGELGTVRRLIRTTFEFLFNKPCQVEFDFERRERDLIL